MTPLTRIILYTDNLASEQEMLLDYFDLLTVTLELMLQNKPLKKSEVVEVVELLGEYPDMVDSFIKRCAGFTDAIQS